MLSLSRKKLLPSILTYKIYQLYKLAQEFLQPKTTKEYSLKLADLRFPLKKKEKKNPKKQVSASYF